MVHAQPTVMPACNRCGGLHEAKLTTNLRTQPANIVRRVDMLQKSAVTREQIEDKLSGARQLVETQQRKCNLCAFQNFNRTKDR